MLQRLAVKNWATRARLPPIRQQQQATLSRPIMIFSLSSLQGLQLLKWGHLRRGAVKNQAAKIWINLGGKKPTGKTEALLGEEGVSFTRPKVALRWWSLLLTYGDAPR